MLPKLEHSNDPFPKAQKLKESKKKDKVTKFIEILFEIFEGAQHPEMFSWSADGSGILISNQVDFSEKMLPKYFKHNNFASFVRQLNIYGFKKIKSEGCDNHYSHEMFRRGRKELLCKIKRKKVSLKDQKVVLKKPEVPKETSTSEGDMAILENHRLKKQHKEMADNLLFLNQKYEKYTSENDMLSERCFSQQQQIDRLKMMLLAGRNPQSNANLNPLLNRELQQQMNPEFSFPGVSQQLNLMLSTQTQGAPKTHLQASSMPVQQANFSPHQQLFTNPQQLMMRQPHLYDAMRLFPNEQNYLDSQSMRFNLPIPGSDPTAFGNGSLKLGIPTDHLTDAIELLEMREAENHGAPN